MVKTIKAYLNIALLKSDTFDEVLYENLTHMLVLESASLIEMTEKQIISVKEYLAEFQDFASFEYGVDEE